MRVGRVATAVAAVVAMVCAACGTLPTVLPERGASSGPPATGNVGLTRIPTLPPATQRRGGVCLVSGGLAPTWAFRGRPPTVDAAPTGAVVAWLPGLNSARCRAYLTNLAAAPAQRLAHEINAAPRFPSGVFNCPSDDGTAIAAYFRVPGAPPDKGQLVVIGLTGCASISAAHRGSRQLTSGVLTGLAASAPPAWRAYLGRGW